MPSVLILCAHRPHRSPSQRYRFEQYLPLLQQEGFNFTYSYLLNEKDDTVFYSKGNFIPKILILLKSIFIRVIDLLRFKKFNIIFIQREALFLGTSYFERKAAASGAFVIFDFDDSIWLADTSPGNKKWEWIKKPSKFFETISATQAVIAGNTYLAERAKAFNTNTCIIPTSIDTDFHFPKPELRNKDVLTIGWSGSVSTVKHFEELIPVLLKIQERFKDKIRFSLLGDAHFTHPSLNVKAIAWTKETEVEVLNSFDIGLMPLPNDEWARGKCGLKGLSYMACGVPTLMSAVGVNNEIIQHGENGFLANTDEEWYTILSSLIEDEQLRKKTGLKGRETVVNKYSVEANKHLYHMLFKNAII
jgi:glycosyltransferase involved in cell wall biosynthesis